MYEIQILESCWISSLSILPKHIAKLPEVIMRAQCKINSLSSLDDEQTLIRLKRSIHLTGAMPDLEIGQTYDVLALEIRHTGVWVFLNTVVEHDYPDPYPIEFFELIDTSLPCDWEVGFENITGGVAIKRITFSEWANDCCFYEKLIEGDEAALCIYQKHLNEPTRHKEGHKE